MHIDRILVWKNERKKRQYIFYFLVYTFVFVIIALFWNRYVLMAGNTLVTDSDTETQFFPGVVYLGQYFRDIIRTFLHTGNLSISSWDINIGLGDDIVGALNQYAFGDVLDLFYIFVPVRWAAYLYSILTVFRLWLTGFAFSCYGLFKRKAHSHVLIASIVYSFNSWTLFVFGLDAYFLNALIYLPFLAIALERLLVKRKKGMFTALLALSLLSSFYFFFMLTIGLVVYAVIFCIRRWKNSPGFIKKSLIAFGLCVWGYIKAILAIAVFFVPVIVSFVNSYRATGSAALKNVFLYPISAYPARLSSLFTYTRSGHDCVLGMSFFVLLAIALVFSQIKYKKMRWAVIICGILYMLPVFSYAMNVGASDLSRWTFLIMFFASIACMNLCGEILECTSKNVRITYFLMVGVYLLLLLGSRYTLNTDTYLTGMVLLGSGIVCLCFLSKKRKVVRVTGMIVILIIECIIRSSSYTALYQSGSFSAKTINNDEVLDYTYPVSKNFKLEKYEQQGYRIDAQNVYGVMASVNYGWTEKTPTISSYYSLLPGDVTRFSHEVGNARESSSVIIQNNDDRTVLNQLMSVKYIFKDSKRKESENRSIPFGYQKVEEQAYQDEYGMGQKKEVYENKYSMPLIYGYDTCISREKYEKLSMNQREQTMLQEAVVEEPGDFLEETPTLNECLVLSKENLLSQLAEYKENIRIKKNGDIVVIKPFAAMICCQIPAGAESYLHIEDFEYQQPDSKFYRKYASLYEREKRNQSAGYFLGMVPIEKVDIQTRTKERQTFMRYNTEYACYSTYSSKLLNLGYASEERTSFTLEFFNQGVYHFEDLKVIAQPFEEEQYASYVNARKDLQVKELKIGNDTISADINAQGQRIVCVGIPYSEGWKVMVDGKEVPSEKVNSMFLGFRVESGKHSVRLEYETPGRALCAKISGGYWIFTLLVLLFRLIRFILCSFEKPTPSEFGN